MQNTRTNKKDRKKNITQVWFPVLFFLKSRVTRKEIKYKRRESGGWGGRKTNKIEMYIELKKARESEREIVLEREDKMKERRQQRWKECVRETK